MSFLSRDSTEHVYILGLMHFEAIFLQYSKISVVSNPLSLLNIRSLHGCYISAAVAPSQLMSYKPLLSGSLQTPVHSCAVFHVKDND